MIICRNCKSNKLKKVITVGSQPLSGIFYKNKKFKSYQVWYVSENEPNLIKSFAKKYWKIYNPKSKLILNKKGAVTFDHISDKSSVWR